MTQYIGLIFLGILALFVIAEKLYSAKKKKNNVKETVSAGCCGGSQHKPAEGDSCGCSSDDADCGCADDNDNCCGGDCECND